MKHVLCCISILSVTTGALAAPSVAFTKILDTTVASVQSYSATYVPVANKYLIGSATDIKVFNGDTGAIETPMSIAGITPGGLGFFAVTADAAGKVYAYEDNGKDIWRWDSVTDPTPEKVYGEAPDAALFARVGSTGGGSGPGVNIAFTGSANNGPVEFFTDNGTTFTRVEAVTMTAKSAMTINKSATKAWATGDTGGLPIHKWTKSGGVWTEDTTNWVPTQGGAGPMAYDEYNDVLFIHPEVGGTTIYALDGTTGATIGSATTTAQLNGTAGYNGAYVQATSQNGTFWGAGRAVGGSTNSVLYKWTYVYTPDASVRDWTLY